MNESPDALSDDVLVQLLDLIDRLREQTAGFLENPADQQLWYDRGYANGMVLALQRMGQQARLDERRPDDRSAFSAQLPLAWGKAYLHGEQRGSDETHEITGIPQT